MRGRKKVPQTGIVAPVIVKMFVNVEMFEVSRKRGMFIFLKKF